MIQAAGSLKERYRLSHERFQGHYFPAQHGGLLLGFTKAWRDQNLPGDMRATNHSKDLLVVLADREDPNDKLYVTHMVVAYEDRPVAGVMDANWNFEEAYSIQSYFYGCHHCP